MAECPYGDEYCQCHDGKGLHALLDRQVQTWTVRDIDGSNQRQVTIEQFRAEGARLTAAAMAKFFADVRSDQNISAKSKAAVLARFARVTGQ